MPSYEFACNFIVPITKALAMSCTKPNCCLIFLFSQSLKLKE